MIVSGKSPLPARARPERRGRAAPSCWSLPPRSEALWRRVDGRRLSSARRSSWSPAFGQRLAVAPTVGARRRSISSVPNRPPRSPTWPRSGRGRITRTSNAGADGGQVGRLTWAPWTGDHLGRGAEHIGTKIHTHCYQALRAACPRFRQFRGPVPLFPYQGVMSLTQGAGRHANRPYAGPERDRGALRYPQPPKPPARRGVPPAPTTRHTGAHVRPRGVVGAGW